ncbi:chemotaxis response regulator protein-glutamate methylesterase [Thalassotalea euphylliae]|uniref:protein-glutamate methylesterase/protein-glutamine glutaminase n=1 Tax=Thalassotalea euphylliae TaxID=1655234 RepID=UPI0036340591
MNKIKVLIVDDSSLIRGVIREVLSIEPAIEVVGEAGDPYEARSLIKQLNPDVLTLDVEMPKMDGITFLSNLMRLRPMPVVMLSTLTTKGADITLEALALGAVDFIAKPSFDVLVANKKRFQEILVEKVKSAGEVDQKNYQLASAVKKNASVDVLSFDGVKRKNHLIAIGASTGGTEAIAQILKCMPANCPPIAIAQHIPEKFSERFAARLDGICEISVTEAKHGQRIKAGVAYIAPGGKHLKIANKSGVLYTTLDDGDKVNLHKPAVDVLFKSLVEHAGNIQAVLLTGMGQDGALGMLELKNNGARTIIQDKTTSLVWGMPGRAHQLGAYTDEMPLMDISSQLLEFATLAKAEMKEALNGRA